MKRCLYTSKNVFMRIFFSLVSVCMGILLMFLAIYFLLIESVNFFLTLMCGMLSLLGIATCAYGVFLYIEQSRNYTISPYGITIYYLKRLKTEYPWNSIGEISICDVNHAAKDASQFDIVIRLVVGNEKKDSTSLISVLSGYDHWRSFEYGLFHFRKILILDYSKDRLHEIQSASKREIKDYRTQRAKKKTGDGFLS